VLIMISLNTKRKCETYANLTKNNINRKRTYMSTSMAALTMNRLMVEDEHLHVLEIILINST
jgi:hypothetical protein